MSRSIVVLAILVFSAALAACKPDASGSREPPAAASAPALHASADVVPGSHEDWCPEHEVPESMCTRCNSSLIPAFKATNDWCAEHALPESQCLKCNPELVIARPAKAE